MKSNCIGWPKQGREYLHRDVLRLEMSVYAEGKGHNVASARKYLRSMGMNITPKGEVVSVEIVSIKTVRSFYICLLIIQIDIFISAFTVVKRVWHMI